ncbi:hypothetical protein N7461_002950 [Penicillium sp. DV-2018c]|nr:hypothetical protein N7461_002950 [Penicillium sp. DV-2018c]
MKPTTFLLFLAPAAVLAESNQPAAPASLSSSTHNSPPLSIRDLAPGVNSLPRRAISIYPLMRHVLQARSEGSLGQTPWIGMAIGLTFTALTAAMLG